ncbi:transcriptional regulator with XRE-family HTH domain [Leifsonia sp. EB41]|uniref:helix-turn-helix domain-containing protein n=1 Tax=Leifsonia sp. EB41 TaxID=3156260 RepID=UPI00351373EA
MADFRIEDNVGARIKFARRERGFRTAREFADSLSGGNVTAAVVENIESGRKADISITQLLNIAHGLGTPPSYLLAPIGRPNAKMDLPNLNDELADMTAAEFDCWLSATPLSSYRPRWAGERVDIEALGSLRQLGTFQRELERLRLVMNVQSASGDADLLRANKDIKRQIDTVSKEVARLVGLLESGGFVDVASEDDDSE